MKHTAHRPWPLPHGPWIMKQGWHDLLFAHWAVPVDLLGPLIPRALEIDTFGGQAWVGVVPFRMSGVRMRGAPAIPGLSRFPELNVRTYVVRDGKPGVWFFSLDAANAVAVWGARTFFHLPYFLATMSCAEDAGWIRYQSERKDRRGSAGSLRARYRAGGEIFHAQPGSIEHFLAERYCLYTADEEGRVIRCEIHHPPWALQLAEAKLQENTIAAAAGITIVDGKPELLHFSRHQEVLVWAPQVLK
ncbi:MAG TPA: DUF2071 domain-containing protein [Candidatus Acidoferrales bacterium]|nr:DUF2071 domain-containing protein [Candidatus Acidoferrales bacterium]